MAENLNQLTSLRPSAIRRGDPNDLERNILVNIKTT
jgi:hypothetical protein